MQSAALQTLSKSVRTCDRLATEGLLLPSAHASFADHVLAGNVLAPGVGYVELALV